jgi:hypothetical protein
MHMDVSHLQNMLETCHTSFVKTRRNRFKNKKNRTYELDDAFGLVSDIPGTSKRSSCGRVCVCV